MESHIATHTSSVPIAAKVQTITPDSQESRSCSVRRTARAARVVKSLKGGLIVCFEEPGVSRARRYRRIQHASGARAPCNDGCLAVERWCAWLAVADENNQSLKVKGMLTESLKLRKAAIGTTTLPWGASSRSSAGCCSMTGATGAAPMAAAAAASFLLTRGMVGVLWYLVGTV